MKKRSTLASNTSSFNGCRCLTCFIVTLIIDTVHFFDGENPRRGKLPYVCLIGIGLKQERMSCLLSEIVSGFGEPDGTTPL